MTGCLTMLGRLGRDNAGNTLAIAAASLIPLMALIGGGVDISRAYMAKTELQSACDAGVLAGRKALSKSGEYGDDEKAKARAMFNFNFNGDKLDVNDVKYETEDNADGQVLGTATATLPTLLMKIFDKDTVPLSVDCMAELQIGNADIMFVLDVTGSMDSPISAGEPKKIDGLKDAVRDFHKTVNQAIVDNRTRIRYGFVPYSQTINIGGLITSGAMPTSYLTDQTSYQTRKAWFETPIVTAPWNPQTPTSSSVDETYSSNITQANCQTNSNNYGNNKYPTGSGGTPIAGGGPAPTATTSTAYAFKSWTKVSGSGSSAVGTCKRTKTTTTTTYVGTTWYTFTRWEYKPRTINTSTWKTKTAFKYATNVASPNSTTPASNARVRTKGDYDMYDLATMVGAGTAANVSTTTGTWSGCIEERKTQYPYASYDFDPIPDDAYDMDLDLEPYNADTSWRPQWPGMMYDRGSYKDYYYKFSTGSDAGWYTSPSYNSSSKVSGPPGAEGNTCPAEMMLFRNVELTDNPDDIPGWLNTYINSLVATGSTYHDLGMIWGGRLTSPTGIFADNVNLDADKINVSKHIIFMTDGKMEPTTSAYSAYGIESMDHRIAPAGTETNAVLTARHNARFSAICEAIKAQGTTIWVIAFGTTMTTQLQNCASSGRAYYSSNTTALRNTFKYIAAQVADLRLGA